MGGDGSSEPRRGPSLRDGQRVLSGQGVELKCCRQRGRQQEQRSGDGNRVEAQLDPSPRVGALRPASGPGRRPPGFGFTLLLLCGWCGRVCTQRPSQAENSESKDLTTQNQERGH